MCRYIARPPLAKERLEEHGDGRLRYRFKRAWRNGTYAVVLEPLDLVARLVALIPPPRFHMLWYHGVLAAHAKTHAEVVPGRAASTPSESVQLGLGFEAETASEPTGEPASTLERAARYPWAWLLVRIFAVDVMMCPHCAGRMRLVKLATTREETDKALAHTGLGPRPPPQGAADDARQARAVISRGLNRHDPRDPLEGRDGQTRAARATSSWSRAEQGP